MKNFSLTNVSITKLKKPFCQVCGRWVVEPVEDSKTEVNTLHELKLKDGAVPILRMCGDCREELTEVLTEE